jgi:hypothetical protein
MQIFRPDVGEKFVQDVSPLRLWRTDTRFFT